MSDAKRPLGQLAVERAYVSQEHLDLCIEYQAALRQSGNRGAKRIGEILIDKGLLTAEQVERLLEEQVGTPPPRRVAPVPAAALMPRAADAADEIEFDEPVRKPPPTEPRFRLRRGHVVAALVLAAIAAIAFLVWPAPAPRRTLVAWLTSCHVDSVQADNSLAAPGLDLRVRLFRIEEALPRTDHEFSAELSSLLARGDNSGWNVLLETVDMPPAKRSALGFAARILPENLSPQKAEELHVAVAPFVCRINFRVHGAKLFRSGTYRFFVIRVRTPRWTSRWRVAGYERAEASKSG